LEANIGFSFKYFNTEQIKFQPGKNI
jgi:hypothetical protein